MASKSLFDFIENTVKSVPVKTEQTYLLPKESDISIKKEEKSNDNIKTVTVLNSVYEIIIE